MKTYFFRKNLIISLLLFMGLIMQLQSYGDSSANNAPGALNNQGIIDTVYKPFKVTLSDEFVTPRVKARIIERYKNPIIRTAPYYGASRYGKLWIPYEMRLSPEKLEQAIPDAPMIPYKGKCPFCKKSFKGAKPNFDSKHTGKTNCCKTTIFSNSADAPANYKLKIDSELVIPYRNGKTYKLGYNSKYIKFFPAAIISYELHKLLLFRLLPSLELKFLLKNDIAAAVNAAAILDRLADVYPVQPWVDVNRKKEVMIAKYKDMNKILTPGRKQEIAKVLKGKDKDAFINAEDYRYIINALQHGKIDEYKSKQFCRPNLNGSRWDLMPQEVLAESWSAVRNLKEVKAFSRKKYGSDMALNKRIINMLKDQAAWARHRKFNHGNFVIGIFAGAIPLSVMTKDKVWAEHIVENIFCHLHNHYFSEGVSTEGAFNYSHMMSEIFMPLVSKEAFGVDYTKRFPWVNNIYTNWDYPIVTLLNIESTHADAHTGFFSSVKLPPLDKLEYAKHEKSQTFSDYGITCLRAGKPGARLEVIMSHQNTIMHTDMDRLAIQLFYEGVNLLPEIGYMTYKANKAREKKFIVKSNFPLIKEPLKLRFDYNDAPEAHCNALINGNQFGLGCATFESFFGGQGIDSPGYLAQFIQVDGTPVYFRHIDPVAVYNRQLMTVNFSNGRPVVLDIFRLQGGRRHDFFWHVPAKMPTSSLGKPQAMPDKDLYNYFTTKVNPPAGWRKEEDPFQRYYKKRKWPYREDFYKHLSEPVQWVPQKNKAWNFTWNIDPERYAPKLKKKNKAWEKWSKFQQPVDLRIWGMPDKNNADSKFIGALGPWGSSYQGFGGIYFDKALSYLIEHRQGKKNLKSTFIHVLEPFTSKQSKTLEQVENIENSILGSDGRGVKLTAVGGEIAYAATTLNSGKFQSKNFNMKGRAGLVLPTAPAVFLYDGTHLQAEKVEVKLESSFKLKLIGVRGDLTGEPTESSLFVESSRPLPTNGILNGYTINVIPKTDKAHTIAYKVAKITKVKDQLYKISLAGKPRFIQFRFFVRKVTKTNKGTSILVNREIIVGNNRPYLLNRNIYFPRSGFKTTIEDTDATGYRAYVTMNYLLKKQPSAKQVKVGDPVIIYAIQPGDAVEINSFFVCRPNSDKSKLAIESGGNAELTLPGNLKFTGVPENVAVSYKGQSVRIKVGPGKYELKMKKTNVN